MPFFVMLCSCQNNHLVISVSYPDEKKLCACLVSNIYNQLSSWDHNAHVIPTFAVGKYYVVFQIPSCILIQDKEKKKAIQ